MDNKQIEFKAENLMIGLLISLILPFLILFLYINPAPEDFYFANEANLFTLWENMRIQYHFTTGRYFQICMLYLAPVNEYPFDVYKVVCFFLMLLFYFVIFLSIKLISRGNLTLKECILISLIILIQYLYAMPEVSSGFYWYGGLTAYHISIILVPLFFYSFFGFEKANNKTSLVLFFIISCLLIIAIEGSNEIVAILFFITLMYKVIKSFFIEKNFKWSYLVFASIAVISLYKLVTSPANNIRASKFPGNHEFIYSFINSFTFLAEKIFSWIFYSPLLAFTLFLIPVFSNLIKKREVNSTMKTVNPILSLLFWLGFLYICTFISLWSTIVVFDRTLNLIYLFFLAGWFLNAFLIYNYFQKKYKFVLRNQLKYVYVVSFVLILICLVKDNNIKTALFDLTGGSSYELDKQMNERFHEIKLCESDSCQVDSLINIPTTIFYKDIKSDPEELSSRWYGEYFGKKIVTLKNSNP